MKACWATINGELTASGLSVNLMGQLNHLNRLLTLSSLLFEVPVEELYSFPTKKGIP